MHGWMDGWETHLYPIKYKKQQHKTAVHINLHQPFPHCLWKHSAVFLCMVPPLTVHQQNRVDWWGHRVLCHLSASISTSVHVHPREHASYLQQRPVWTNIAPKHYSWFTAPHVSETYLFNLLSNWPVMEACHAHIQPLHHFISSSQKTPVPAEDW